MCYDKFFVKSYINAYSIMTGNLFIVEPNTSSIYDYISSFFFFHFFPALLKYN